MSEVQPTRDEGAARGESRARAAARLVLGSELLPGPVPLPDFASLMASRVRWRRRRLTVGAFGSLATAALVAVLALWERAPISYVVDGTVAIADGVIDAAGKTGDVSASVRFSEGTEVALAQGARLRVIGRTANGAALALDRGRARFAVTHRSGARWSVATGPFTIEVIGTRFALDWSPREERLVVDLTAGSVMVRGASVGGPVAMHPGERLIATAADRRVTLSPLSEAQSSAADRPSEPGDDIMANDPTPPDLGDAPELPARDPAALAAAAAEPEAERESGSMRIASSSFRSNRRGGHRSRLALAAPSRQPVQARVPARLEEQMEDLEGTPTTATAAPSREGPATAAVPPGAAAPAPSPPPAPTLAPARAESQPPRVVPPATPSFTMASGGAACAREGAQYRFERAESGIMLPDFYTLAFSSPRTDHTHSWCGQSSLRVDANFSEAGRRNFFGRFPKETGQVVLKLHRATDFTGKTVTVHFFVEGPVDARFTAELVVVNRGRWVSGPPSGHLTAGRWWTITHRFEAENESGVPGSSNPGPFPVGGTSPVSSCDRLGLAIHSTGGRRVWTGAVYVDDVGWK